MAGTAQRTADGPDRVTHAVWGGQKADHFGKFNDFGISWTARFCRNYRASKVMPYTECVISPLRNCYGIAKSSCNNDVIVVVSHKVLDILRPCPAALGCPWKTEIIESPQRVGTYGLTKLCGPPVRAVHPSVRGYVPLAARLASLMSLSNPSTPSLSGSIGGFFSSAAKWNASLRVVKFIREYRNFKLSKSRFSCFEGCEN